MKRKSVLTLFLLMLFSIQAYSDAPRFVINSSHNGNVTDLEILESKNMLFSAGFDGTVKIWDITTGALEYSFQVSHMPVKSIAVSSATPHFAVIESDGINMAMLSIWNYETNERIVKKNLTEFPLFLSFSPKGSFLFYGKTEWNSLVFIETETGRTLPYLEDGFGIVSSAFLSDSEKTIMTYSPSGNIHYWDLRAGSLKKKVQTVSSLTMVNFSRNGRYMTGYNGRAVMLIDLVSGKTVDSINAPSIQQAVVNNTEDILCITTQSGSDTVYDWYGFDGDGFSDASSHTAWSSSTPLTLSASGGFIFSGHGDGLIRKIDTGLSSSARFSGNVLLPVDDFAINGSSMVVASGSRLISISSSFLKNLKAELADPAADSIVYDLDPRKTYSLSTVDSDSFLLWTTSGNDGGEISLFRTGEGIVRSISKTKAPLVSVDYQDGKVLSLDVNGECRVTDFNTGREIFSYSSFGLRDVCFVDRGNIMGARSSTTAMDTPLLHINTTTGETVPIGDSNMLTFKVDYDPVTRKLYTLGFENRKGKMKTILKEHTGRNYERAFTLLAYPGEDIGASFATDRGSSKIFTSLGYGGVKMLYWGGFTSLDTPESISRNIKFLNNVIISLNSDNSFTIWDSANGRRLLDLYIFSDLSWAAVSADRFYASPLAADKISLYEGNGIIRLDAESYRVREKGN